MSGLQLNLMVYYVFLLEIHLIRSTSIISHEIQFDANLWTKVCFVVGCRMEMEMEVQHHVKQKTENSEYCLECVVCTYFIRSFSSSSF